MAGVVDKASALNARVAYRVMLHIVFERLSGFLVDWLWCLNLLCGFVDFLELGEVCVEHVSMIKAVVLVNPREVGRFNKIALKR